MNNESSGKGDTSPSSSPSSLLAWAQERQQAALNELSALNRVFHRLAMVDTTDKLEQVLDKLLPRLLKRMGDNQRQQKEIQRQPTAGAAASATISALQDTYGKIHSKLVEMMSHITKRVREDKNCKLPCEGILALLVVQDEVVEQRNDETISRPAEAISIPKICSVNPFTLNLALAFLTLGLPRCARLEAESMIAGLVLLLGEHSGIQSLQTPAKRSQAHQVAHLLLRSIEKCVTTPASSTNLDTPVTQRPSSLSASSTLAGVKMNMVEVAASSSPSFHNLKRIRDVCAADEAAAAALYDLLLDVLLYQPLPGISATTNLPPDGLSQAGNERLVSGASSLAPNWASEMAQSSIRLKDMKLAMLEFISPSRRFVPLLPLINTTSTAATSDLNKEQQLLLLKQQRAVARTVALLVVATGIEHPDVSERALTFLKIYLDSFRGKENGMTLALGDPIALSCEMLSLTLGHALAESIMAAANLPKLEGSLISATVSTTSSPNRTALVLSLQRRKTSDKVSSAITSFVATKVIEECPQSLVSANAIQTVGKFAVTTSQRMLSNLETSSGLSLLRASPFVASAQLLHSICNRLVAVYDNDNNQVAILKKLMAQALSTVCKVLAGVSSPRPVSTRVAVSNDGNVAVRDSCYGVICSLSRSRFALCGEGYLFACGKENSSVAVATGIDTASLLFGCAANEDEILRPAAVAALDALLAAYCRVHVKKNEESTADSCLALPVIEMASNPWANASSDVTVEQAPVVCDSKEGLSKALLPLLWTAGQSTQPKASRVAAARWSCDLMRFLDLRQACHLLCFLAGDPDLSASVIARDALGLKNGSDEDVVRSISESTVLPGLSDLTRTIFSDRLARSTTWRPSYFDFSFRSKSATIRVGLACLLSDIYGGSNEAVQTYVAAVAGAIALFDPQRGPSATSRGRDAIELFEESSICLAWSLSTSKIARSIIAGGNSGLSMADVERLSLAADTSVTRRYLAKAAGSLYEDSSLWGEIDGDVVQWLDKTKVVNTMETCSRILGRSHSSIGEIHGSSFLGAQCLRAFRLRLARQPSAAAEADFGAAWHTASTLIGLLGQGTKLVDEVIGNAFADALFTALSFEGSDAPILNARLFPGTSSALVDLDFALRKYATGDQANPTRSSKLAFSAGVCLAASTSGAGVDLSGTQESHGIGRSRLQCAMTLFSLLGSQAYQKDEELALTVGEALGYYADAYSPKNVIWSSELPAWPETYDEEVAQALPPHQQVPYILLRRESKSSSPQKRVASAPALLGVVGRAARIVNRDQSCNNRSLVKELMKHLEEIQGVFVTIIADPKCNQLARESCCLGLAACYGLAKVTGGSSGGGYEQQSTLSRSMELNDRLLRSFGQTTRYAGSLFMETAEQAADRRRSESVNDRDRSTDTSGSANEEGEGPDAEIGGVTGLGEAALGAFREMAAAAVSLGRPDVLYALLMLSRSHPVWLTSGPRERYGEESLLGDSSVLGSDGTNTAKFGEALRPHLGKLLPRILRARHDPNKQTRAQMNALWNGLTRGGLDARLAINENFLPTFDVLLDDATTSKFWRARVGACGALIEILSGRSWDELGGGSAILDDDEVFTQATTANTGAAIRLLRLWRGVVRALDDIRLAVRDAGESLGRALRALTVRLCDPSTAKNSGESKEVSLQRERHAVAAAGTSLRWLVTHGLKQVIPEARGICFSCLVAIIDVVPPRILQPVLCDLIGHLLMSMSSLEPAALNYLQVRTTLSTNQSEAYDRLESIRLQLTQNSPLASALAKCLEMLPSLDVSLQRSVVAQLDSALRRGIGFATRAATADAVSSLCATCPSAFRFVGSSIANPSVRLLRALYLASERERGQSARDRMAHALGNLARLAPGSSVRSLALRACERYNTSCGNHDDPLARRAAAAALRSLVVRASNQVSEGGNGDIWCKRILPAAFLGRKDDDSKVASLWQEVWDEGGSALGSNGKEFGTLVEERLLPYLVAACVRALKELSWSRRVAAARALVDLCNTSVLAPVPQSLVEGATQIDQARSKNRAQSANVALRACVEVLTGSRLWTGKSEVVTATVTIASKWCSVGSEALGWTDQGLCPWTPIVVSLQQFDNHLFVGDAWFLSDHEDVDAAVKETSSADGMAAVDIHVEETADGQPINFEEGWETAAFPGCEEVEEDISSQKQETNMSKNETLSVVSFSGLCRILIDQGFPSPKKASLALEDDLLPFKTASLKGFASLLDSLADSDTSKRQVKYLYELVAPRLISVVDSDNIFGFMDTTETSHAPVLVARTIDCLASVLWEGIGSDDTETVMKLSNFFKVAGGSKQPAWSVREAATMGAARLACKCDISALRRSETVLIMMECTKQSLADRKFWRVRLAGLKILRSLANRTSSTNARIPLQGGDANYKQLLLETILPFKEDFLKFLRSGLTDTEPQVSSLSTEVLTSMAWWP